MSWVVSETWVVPRRYRNIQEPVHPSLPLQLVFLFGCCFTLRFLFIISPGTSGAAATATAFSPILFGVNVFIGAAAAAAVTFPYLPVNWNLISIDMRCEVFSCYPPLLYRRCRLTPSTGNSSFIWNKQRDAVQVSFSWAVDVCVCVCLSTTSCNRPIPYGFERE